MENYLTGQILTSDRQSVANALYTFDTPPLEQLATAEIARLRHAYKPLTADGNGVDVIKVFGDVIGINSEVLAGFMSKHSVSRNHTFLSDPYIIRDLFHDDKSLTDSGARLSDITGDAQNIFFQPTTTWSKAGNGVFRFAIMHKTTGHEGSDSGLAKQIRIPVVMIDNKKMDTILHYEGERSVVLKQLKDMMATACHDYIHTTFLYYVKNRAPSHIEQWDDQLQGGKPIWRNSAIFNYNYEVLASIGHRQIMQRMYEEHPEIKAGIIARVREFAESVGNLCELIRADGKVKEAENMEHYLMTNYMRFAYHILKPNEAELEWVRDRFPYIEKDLNLHNGKGLVAIIHAHEGVPGAGTGDKDISFPQWLNEYVTAHLPVLDGEPRLFTKRSLRQTNVTGIA